MKQQLLLYILFFFFVPSFAQIEESFSDGNLSNNPTWQGDIADFIINTDNQLQLNATNGGESRIYVNTFIEKETEWSFFFKMNFNPSTSNALRVYLQSDSRDLLNGSGYFLEIGESGSQDAIKLYRQDNGNKVLLATATPGLVAVNPSVKVKIVREKEGNWNIFADYNGGNDLELEASTADATYIENGFRFFGLYCKYTATRTDGFSFDDIFVQALNEDTSPPILIDIKAIAEQTIELVFNEPIDENEAINPINYFINKGIGNPQSVSLFATNQVVLNLNNPLSNNENYTININNIVDLKGNTLTKFDTIFTFIKVEMAAQYDLLINEIMEDPTLDGGGTLGLPNQEYVELFNRSNKSINLEGFVFTDGSSKSALFPFYLFLPNTYLIIAKKGATELGSFGNFLELSNFPTLSSEEELVLKNEFGEIIDVVNYTQDWYRSTTKAKGGFSLERINPQNSCEGSNNWSASSSLLGGTPGKENAIFDLTTDGLNLDFIDAFPLDATHIRLSFNKAANRVDLLNNANYTITNNNIISATLVENNFNQVTIELASPLTENSIETIEISTSFTDCIGNLISESRTKSIALPVLAEPNDIIINEILFNPQVGGVDFLELYNRSEKVIDLSSLVIINLARDRPVGEPVVTQKLIFPKEYVALTESPADIQNRYQVENSTDLFLQDLPNFPDKSGNVSLFTNKLNETIIIDKFDYSDNLHNTLLNDKNGISLERINPNLPTQSSGNWHSAASTIGYASPTSQNSQNIVEAIKQPAIFSLSSNRISPDGDGFEDILQINYTLEKAGFSTTIHIYDAVGRLIKKLAQNQLLSTTGSFKWDGTTTDGQKAKVGIYVLWIEYFSTNGETFQEKEAIVVAGKL